MRVVLFGVLCAAAASAASVPTQVTFYKDVLPVLENNCQTCHRPGEAAPMTFLSYESTRPWAKAIKSAVLSRKMPPWFADPHVGKWSNDRSLSAADINTLVAWADTGAKAGDPKDAPAPMQFIEGWRIPTPDKVIEMPAEFPVPASGAIDYQYIVIPTGFTEDKYVQFAEARPGNPKLVHHIIAFIREPGNPWLRDAKPGIPFVPREVARQKANEPKDTSAKPQERRPEGTFSGEFLAGYAPGTIPQLLKPGQAKLVKAGSDIVLQLHYTADGKPGLDRSRVGLVFAKQQPREKVLTLAASTMNFEIPAGAPGHRVDSKIKLYEDATLISLLPHMHLRGKSFEYRAVYPTGETEKLLVVPKYDFNWQLSYYFDQPKVLPKGTVIECTAYYDNSPNNPANPDPSKVVRFGEQSWEEMMFGFFDVAVKPDVNLVDVVRPRKPAAASSDD